MVEGDGGGGGKGLRQGGTLDLGELVPGALMAVCRCEAGATALANVLADFKDPVEQHQCSEGDCDADGCVVRGC